MFHSTQRPPPSKGGSVQGTTHFTRAWKGGFGRRDEYTKVVNTWRINRKGYQDETQQRTHPLSCKILIACNKFKLIYKLRG